MKNTFKQVLQVILRIYIVQLTAFYQEKMNAGVSAAASLPIFIQFLSSSFTGFILCSQRLLDISAEPILEDISQGFPLVYRVVRSLSYRFS
ncbi:MAG: hypothetical protein ACLVEU_14725 [Bacteroides cellulosilyticus]